jgi:lactoylglutathione lyase
MTDLQRTTTLIELHVPDFSLVRDFYLPLGFEVVREETLEDKYLVLQLEDNLLCFWGGDDRIYQHGYFKDFSKNTKRGYGIEIVLMVSNIEEYYHRIKDLKGIKIVAELKLRPWGVKDFRVEDPFSFYLRFTKSHDVLRIKIK